MFTCAECHMKHYATEMGDVHFSGSRGPCEWCREVALCADCHCTTPKDAALRNIKAASTEETLKHAEKIREEFRRKR